MFCSGCGAELPRGVAPAIPSAATPATPPAPGHFSPAGPFAPPPLYGGSPPAYAPPAYYPPIQPVTQYAGFWLRVVASFVDSLVMIPLGMVAVAIFGGAIFANLDRLQGDPDPAVIASFIGAYALVGIIFFVGTWLYHAYMESSRHQATLGKLALGLCVTDLNGNRISFGRASGRHFSKLITGMTFGVGYAMAGFTERRQCLHDMIAGCLVVKK